MAYTKPHLERWGNKKIYFTPPFKVGRQKPRWGSENQVGRQMKRLEYTLNQPALLHSLMNL